MYIYFISVTMPTNTEMRLPMSEKSQARLMKDLLVRDSLWSMLGTRPEPNWIQRWQCPPVPESKN